ncbi:CpaD family pilus assembly lipoprotein [Bradyrhizobium centrosematis]|uniref:CpaD family pilus assembly lipoprotein n=1 Tax=Bradyrhizobium centrosematis TaxID=1300039 RepID=UPI00388F7779
MILRQMCHLIGIAATLGGCASTASVHYGPAEQTVQVEQKRSILFLQSLRRPEANRLRCFIATSSRGRPDALHLNVIGAPRIIAQVAHQARAMGVAPYNIRLSASALDLSTRAGAKIEAITFEAYPPSCPSLSIVGPAVNDNSFDPTLGCSTRNNLATMVNDPVDLLENRSTMPSNGERAADPLAREGTFAPRSKSKGEDGAGDKVGPDAAGAKTRDNQPFR